MNGDDFDGGDYKHISLPSAQQEEAWKKEARALLDQLRASKICVFVGAAPRQESWLDCLPLAGAYGVLICFEAVLGKAAIRAEFAHLEGHLLHNHQYIAGGVKFTSVRQESELNYREAAQQDVFFPDAGVLWHTDEPEPDDSKKWLHHAEVTCEIRRQPHPPQQRHIRVIHIGFSEPFVWPLFMMPHCLKANIVIVDPPH